MAKNFYFIKTGDLVTLKTDILFANAYKDSFPFRYGDIDFTIDQRETGIVLSRISENNISILYHHIRILFSNGKIGIVIADNLRIIQSSSVISWCRSINNYMGSYSRLLHSSKLKTGDLTSVSYGNDYVNVYEDRFPISFSHLIYKAVTGDICVILSRLEPLSENDTLHPQYVKVFFSKGIVGVIRASTLEPIV